MKKIFFILVVTGIFLGITISAKAQPAVNSMRANEVQKPQKKPRFIEGIEIRPETNSSGSINIETALINSPFSSVKSDPVLSSAIENCSSIQFKYAQLMDIEVEKITNPLLYNYINDWWATPYKYGGRTKSGIDCSAFAEMLLKNIYGIQMPRTAREQYGICEKITIEDSREGDLLFFNTRGGISHVGIYLGYGFFAHASVFNGVTINNLDDPYYKRKFFGVGRISSFTDVKNKTVLK